MAEKYVISHFDTHTPIKCSIEMIGHIGPHRHEHFEVDMVLSGRCDLVVGDRLCALGPDDVFSIDGHVTHEIRGFECVVVSLEFDQSIFEQTLPTPLHPEFDCNSRLHGDSAAYDALRRLIARLVKNNADRQTGYELRNWSLVYRLMDLFFNNFRVERSQAEELKSHRYAARISEITRIIKERYAENLSLTDLADAVHLSAPYLAKFFNNQFGMTYLAYLTRFRLDSAVRDLLNTEKTIEEISQAAGFANTHAFVQAFKREYGELPSVYRRRSRGEPRQPAVPVVEQHDYMSGLKKYLTDGESAPATESQGVSCAVRLDAAKTLRTLSHTWRNVMTVGAAADVLLSDVQQMIRRVQEEIGFRYIKLAGVFSDDLHVCSRRPDGGLAFNFAYFDRVFDFALGVGLKPFVQFSYMPQALAKKPRFLFNSIVSEPVDVGEWCALVEAATEHLVARYGIGEVSSWHFCVWNQPDTPEWLYGFGDDARFYEFYRRTYQAVKSRWPSVFFGATPTFYVLADGYRNWYLDFLEWTRKKDCVPDFLNFTYYDTTVFTGSAASRKEFGFVDNMNLSTNGDSFSRFVDQALDERERSGFSSAPIYLTEWNNTPSQQDLLNDTCFKSCYIVKNILKNYDRLYSFGYWSLTDLMSEAPLPEKLFFGGLGLFTKNGIPKPAYYAFRLLDMLGDGLIGSGDGWFATRSGGEWRIILYNYRHFSDLYAMGERFDMTFNDRYTVFEPTRTLDVHLTLNGVEDGEYVVSETSVGRRSGSAFDTWVEMGASEPDTAEELDVLRARSTPMITKYRQRASGGVLELDAMLDTLEVRLLRIKKK